MNPVASCSPLRSLSVHVVLVLPLASVVPELGDTEPSPRTAAKPTFTPLRGLPFESSTRTPSAMGPSVPTCGVPLGAVHSATISNAVSGSVTVRSQLETANAAASTSATRSALGSRRGSALTGSAPRRWSEWRPRGERYVVPDHGAAGHSRHEHGRSPKRGRAHDRVTHAALCAEDQVAFSLARVGLAADRRGSEPRHGVHGVGGIDQQTRPPIDPQGAGVAPVRDGASE